MGAKDEPKLYEELKEEIEKDIQQKGFFYVDEKVKDGVSFSPEEKKEFEDMLSSGKYGVEYLVEETDEGDNTFHFIYNYKRVRPVKVDSVCDFLEKVGLHKSETVNRYFRGEKAYYKLLPSLFRYKEWVENEMELNARVYNDRPGDFIDCTSTFDKLVKLKHYVHPSRLLDISSSPLVALFFACNSEVGDENATGVVLEIYCRKEDEKFSVSSDTVVMLTAMTNTKLRKRKKEINAQNEPSKTEVDDKGNLILTCKKEEYVGSKCEHICPKKDKESCYHKCWPGTETKGMQKKVMGEDTWAYKYIGELCHQCKKEGMSIYWDDVCFNELNQCILVKPPLNNDRIVRQQGSFIMCGMNPDDIYKPPKSLYEFFKYKDDDAPASNQAGNPTAGKGISESVGESQAVANKDEIVNQDDKIAKVYYILPEKKDDILKELDVLGLNEYYFFPELEREIRVVSESVKKPKKGENACNEGSSKGT